MKKILLIMFLIVGFLQAQNTVDYYGANNGKYSDSLKIAVGDSTTGEYWVFDKLMYLQVDSNWTASNIAIMVYNDYEGTWELLQDGDKVLIEYGMTQGRTTALVPIEVAGAKKIKFAKMTSGAYVLQATTPSTIIVHSIRY